MEEIFPVATNKDLEIAKQLFVEYADCLGFDLGFQNFEEELANLPGDYKWHLREFCKLFGLEAWVV